MVDSYRISFSSSASALPYYRPMKKVNYTLFVVFVGDICLAYLPGSLTILNSELDLLFSSKQWAAVTIAVLSMIDPPHISVSG